MSLGTVGPRPPSRGEPGAGQDVNRDCTGALQADAGERSGERLVMRFRERR